jgi:uncharacterized membrane protein
MRARFCGTLITPMAANLNALPLALLEIKDRNHRGTAALAAILLPAHIPLTCFLVDKDE